MVFLMVFETILGGAHAGPLELLFGPLYGTSRGAACVIEEARMNIDGTVMFSMLFMWDIEARCMKYFEDQVRAEFHNAGELDFQHPLVAAPSASHAVLRGPFGLGVPQVESRTR